eukprot:715361-Rhodomonas_salina.1
MAYGVWRNQPVLTGATVLRACYAMSGTDLVRFRLHVFCLRTAPYGPLPQGGLPLVLNTPPAINSIPPCSPYTLYSNPVPFRVFPPGST